MEPKIKVRVCTCAERVPDFMSWQIMRQTGKSISHIFILYKGEVFHAIEKGVCRETFDEAKFLEEHYMPHVKEVQTVFTEAEFYAWFKKVEGLPYGFSQMPGYVFPKWMRWIRWFFKNGRAAAVCCEFVVWFMHDATDHPKFRDDKDADFSTPFETIEAI